LLLSNPFPNLLRAEENAYIEKVIKKKIARIDGILKHLYRVKMQ
jgi:hypothetical protein